IAIAPFPKPTKFIVASDEKTLRICDFESGTISRFVDELASRIWSVTVSPEEELIASGHSDRTIRFFHAKSGAILDPPIVDHTDYVRCVVFAPKAPILASSSDDGTVRLWDTKTRLQKGSSMLHDDWVRHVAFSPNEDIVASACDDSYVYLWDVETNDLVATSASHGGSMVWAVSFSPNGLYLASGATDSSVRLWRLSRSGIGNLLDVRLVRRLAGHGDVIRSVAFSRDSKRLCSTSDDGTARIWEIPSGAVVRVLRGHDSTVNGALYSYEQTAQVDRARIVTCSSDGTVRRWD
ncbi:WD40 repeat-like protein, partial [Exidia glandulosa HHB12029]